MPVRNILITEPANPVLRQLAMRFLQKSDLRLICFGGCDCGEERLLQILPATEPGQFRYTDCGEISVDEIWHTVNSDDSVEECGKKTKRALVFATRPEAPVLHYLSDATVGASRAGQLPNGMLRDGDDEHKHLMNEMEIEQSGCKFRLYRIPPGPEALFHSSSRWAQFVEHLLRFKIEIEDRIPGYFASQPLRLYLPEGCNMDAAQSDGVAQALEQILKTGIAGTCFHLGTQQPLSVKECLQMLGESAGMRLQIEPSRDPQNYIDRLFGSRVETFLRHLEHPAQAAGEGASRSSSAEQIWVSVPPISPLDLVAACQSRLQSRTEEPVDWKAGFEQKQVPLTSGGVLNYYVGGEGQETLVLLNAYGQSFKYWERFIRAVYPQFRLILWMPRGNDGDTIGLKVASPQAVHAGDLERVLRQEEVENCTLLAWCSGPRLALEYCRRYPDRISSMVFVAASFKGPRQYKALETEYEKNLEPLMEAIEKYPETADLVLEYLRGTLLSQGAQAGGVDGLAAMSDRDLRQALSAVNVSLRELVLHPFHGTNVVAYATQMCIFWKHDFIAGLDKVRVPVLFVGGDCDRIASQAIAEAVAALMPQARYLKIEGATHYIHYDQWDLLAGITRRIVNSGAGLNSAPRGPKRAGFHQEAAAGRQC